MRSIFLLFIAFLLYAPGVYAQVSGLELVEDKRLELPGISIRAIQVVDSSEIWFAGSNGRIGRVNHTGLLLDSISNDNRNPSFRSIAFNGKHIYVLSIENPALLYRLNVAGSRITSELVYKEVGEKVFYDAMIFMGPNRGIAMGDPVKDCFSVIITEDGGQNWKKLTCNALPGVEPGEAAFAASNTNLATKGGTVWMVSGGKSARVWMSKDFGHQWKVVQTPIQQGKNMTGIFTTAFYDQYRGVIMGGNWEDKKDSNQSKARTSDGGQSWQLMADGKDPGYISCVQYIPESDGKELIAVSTEGVFYSSNAGAQWTRISEEGFFSIRFYDKHTAWLSGNQKIVKFKLNRI